MHDDENGSNQLANRELLELAGARYTLQIRHSHC